MSRILSTAETEWAYKQHINGRTYREVAAALYVSPKTVYRAIRERKKIKMFKCNDCGAKFDSPRLHLETHGLSAPPFEERAECPECGSTDYKEPKGCRYCGDDITDSRADDICEDCLKEIEFRFSEMLNRKFEEAEIKALNIIFEGKDLK